MVHVTRLSLKGLHWDAYAALVVHAIDREAQELNKTAHSPSSWNRARTTDYLLPVHTRELLGYG